MAGRREVDVDRPEHSWIPFYRELAEKLVDPNEGWRGRQDELMDFVREMARDEIMGVPRKVADCEDPYVDPFSLFACFSNSSKGERRLLTMQRVSEFFGLQSKVLHADFYVPEVYSMYMLFWTGESGYKSDVEKHWELFECIMQITSLDEATDNAKLVELMDASLDVIGVLATKLSSAFYWINPFIFLERKTINGVLGNEVVKEDADASAYLDGLALARRIDARPSPVVNDEVYLRDHTPEAVPKVWMVRGGREESAVDLFLSEERVGIGFNMDRADLSQVSNRDEIESAYRNANKEASSSRVGQNVGQIKTFVLDMKVGDYVIMPVGGHVRYGAVTSRPYHDPDVIYENNRSVAWYEAPIPRESLSQLPPRKTVSEVKDQLLEEFWSWVRPSSRSEFKMPEDSWVPFHLAVAEKLIDGEWWKPENRNKFDDLVTKVATTAGVINAETTDGWTPDPYSLYLAFNTASDDRTRQASYEKIREMFAVALNSPELGNYARRYGVHYWSEMRLEETGVDFLWNFFRFLCDADPANDSDDEEEFVRCFDAVLSNDVPGMASATLSQWLYWIDPTRYLLARRIHANELGLADHLGLAEPIEGGAKYVEALKAVDDFAKSRGMTMLDINRESTTRETLGLDDSADTSLEAYGVSTMLKEGVFLEESDIKRMLRILRSKKNLILQGPPGVGKTFIAKRLAYALIGQRAKGQVASVQLHQSYSYEDFVGGYRPNAKNGQMFFEPKDGRFLDVCKSAKNRPDDDFVVLIDEINRGNLSRVFGELLMLIEADKRDVEYGVELQHRTDDDEKFFVPENVYIIGTMNLADRSLTGMNVAMRRRFGFVNLNPQFKQLVFTNWLARETDMPPEWREWINSKMFDLNQTIANHPSLNENYAVGHSFFCPRERAPEEGWNEWYETVVKYEIRPLLREYWFDDPDTAKIEADKLLRDRQ